MELKIYIYSAAEMEAFAAYLTTVAAAKREEEKNSPKDRLFGLAGIDRTTNAHWQTRTFGDAPTEEVIETALETSEAAVVETEKPKRGRKPKDPHPAREPGTRYWHNEKTGEVTVTEGIADLPGGTVEIAKAEYEERLAVGQESTRQDAVAEEPTFTEADVRTKLLDYLSAAQAAHLADDSITEKDPGIRSKVLKPILDAIGATKISDIAPEKYGAAIELAGKAMAELNA